MSFKDLTIEKSYETGEDRSLLLENFYVPMLEQATQYYRIAGYFSSSSLVVASKGIEGLIQNGGTMRLLISPRISENDLRILKLNEGNALSENMDMFEAFQTRDFKELDNLQALSWLLANKRLEIKIVVDEQSGNSIFHQKIGIGYDEAGNMLSFSGSINETAQAWLDNIEEFKTFKSWEPGQIDYLIGDLQKFNAYWNDEKQNIARVYDLPTSIENKIIEVAPRDVADLSIMKRYQEKKKKEIDDISLFAHQREAVKMWEENNYCLLMEMATGTGKTRTAIGCMLKLKKKCENFAVIVATPQNTLSRQWKKDIEGLDIHFDIEKIVDGGNQRWKSDLEIALLDLNSGMYNNAILYTTHDTVSSSRFVDIINRNAGCTNIMFICDEVHAIGSGHQREALLDKYKYRVGLSATPERMFDEKGTGIIREYFGGKSYEFTIKDALGRINPMTGRPFLNPFYYHPVFVDLTDEEMNRYSKISKQIAVLMAQDDIDREDLDKLMIKRANILKNAKLKDSVLEDIILQLNKNGDIKDTIIFETEKKIDSTLNMLSSHAITRCKITEEESAKKKLGIRGNTEREEYIEQFREGKVQVLVGIKCLDEGIDITTARTAILVASSTNPREYVQRVGRVIRPAPGKKESHIYDLIVNPTGGDSLILEKEARRAFQIAENAINKDEVRDIFKKCGVTVDEN